MSTNLSLEVEVCFVTHFEPNQNAPLDNMVMDVHEIWCEYLWSLEEESGGWLLGDPLTFFRPSMTSLQGPPSG